MVEAEWEKIERNAHNFKEQSELVGVLIAKQPSKFEGNDYLIEVKPSKRLIVFGKTALQSKMEAVEIGQQVKIVYIGEEKSDKGRMYDDFDVYVKKEVQSNGDNISR